MRPRTRRDFDKRDGGEGAIVGVRVAPANTRQPHALLVQEFDRRRGLVALLLFLEKRRVFSHLNRRNSRVGTSFRATERQQVRTESPMTTTTTIDTIRTFAQRLPASAGIPLGNDDDDTSRLGRALQQGPRGSILAADAALNSSRRPTIVLDGHGALLWASTRARSLLRWDRNHEAAVPTALREAALQLAAVAREYPFAAPTKSLQLVCVDGESVPVDIRAVRTDVGVLLVVELDPTLQSRLAALAAQFKLSAAQASVLRSLVQGCSDKEISVRHAVSIATVRSHLGKILSKLGVESRLQAALLAARHE